MPPLAPIIMSYYYRDVVLSRKDVVLLSFLILEWVRVESVSQSISQSSRVSRVSHNIPGRLLYCKTAEAQFFPFAFSELFPSLKKTLSPLFGKQRRLFRWVRDQYILICLFSIFYNSSSTKKDHCEQIFATITYQRFFLCQW